VPFAVAHQFFVEEDYANHKCAHQCFVKVDHALHMTWQVINVQLGIRIPYAVAFMAHKWATCLCARYGGVWKPNDTWLSQSD
jgi:hypothetical protein